MRTLHITIPESQHQAVKDFLKSIPAVEVSEDSDPCILPSKALADEKPSDFDGPWKGDDRDFQEIRRKSWTKKR
ncbi:hypothetical protein ACO2Q8_08795 [Larkinella sp. VNQ87]|uniref:hypothetical protein n=1 Tax=Larkinella sp. VNQ87 TaxID=3400921 RepID=UPI003C025173